MPLPRNKKDNIHLDMSILPKYVSSPEIYTIEPVLSGHSKEDQKLFFQDPLSLNAGQKYSRMLQAFCNTFDLIISRKLPYAIKACVLSIFKWPLKTGFTVLVNSESYTFFGVHYFRDMASKNSFSGAKQNLY